MKHEESYGPGRRKRGMVVNARAATTVLGKESEEELDSTKECNNVKDLSGAKEELGEARRYNARGGGDEELGAWRRSPLAQWMWERAVT
jgi:hypothetical protein